MYASNERQAGLALILKIWNDHSRRNPKGLEFSGGVLVLVILLSSCGGGISNQAPIVEEIADHSFPEDTQSSVDIIASDDRNESEELIYTISGHSNINATIDGSTIALSATNNFNGSGEFTVAVEDASGLQSSMIFNVTVEPVNDAPVLAYVMNQNLLEDGQLTLNLNDYYSDVDNNKVDLRLDVGVSGDAVANIVDGQLTIISNENYNGEIEVWLTVSDLELSDYENFKLIVDAVNDLPVIKNIDDVEFDEDALGKVVFDVTDIDNDLSELDFIIEGQDSISGTIEGSYISFSAPENYHGTEILTLLVSDGEDTVSQSFSVIVKAINDAPIWGSISDSVIDEDSIYELSLLPLVSDVDTDMDSLTFFAYIDGNANITLSNKVMHIQPDADYSGNIEVLLKLSDGELSAFEDFILTVEAVNDAPVLRVVEAVFFDEDSSDSITLSAIDAEDTELTYSISGGDNITAILDGDSVFFTAVKDFSGSEEFVVSVTDGVFSDSQSVIVTVNAVNDAPEIVSNAILSATEDQLYLYQVEAVDVDNEITALSLLMNSSPAGMSISDSGLLSWLPGNGVLSSGEVTIIVSDGELSAEQQFEIVVTAVNDPPILSFSDIVLDQSGFAMISLVGLYSDEETAFADLSLSFSASSNLNFDLSNPDFLAISNIDLAGSFTDVVTTTVSDGVNEVEQVFSVEYIYSPIISDSVFTYFVFMEEYSADRNYVVSNFINLDLLNDPSVAVESGAYADELGKTSPDNFLGDALFLVGPSIENGDLTFELADNLELFDYAIVSLNDEYYFPIINGYVQPISYHPDYDDVSIGSTDSAVVSFSVKDLYEYQQLAGDLVLYTSTHNDSAWSTGQGDYDLQVNNDINFSGQLSAEDSSYWYMYQGHYYFDRYFFTVLQHNDEYTVTVTNENGENQSLTLGEDELITINYVPGVSLQRPYLEFVIENDDVIIGTDHYFADQWHLLYSQAPYVWQDLSITGNNVTAAVVEDDFQVTHPDLENQMSSTVDSVPIQPTGDSWHATAVAGVIAAQAANGVGVAGAAPQAELVSINYSTELYLYGDELIDIYSNSWGPDDDTGTIDSPDWWSWELSEMQQAALDDNAMVLFANGNGGGFDEPSTFDPIVNSIYSLAIQAIGQDNQDSGYSERGSNVVFSAYSDTWNYGNGITTTAPFDSYEFDFGGTSSATPLAAGLVALILDQAKQSDMDLNWRDIISLAAHYSLKTDLFDDSWETNQAGVQYHPYYGFGTLNPYTAVEAVRDTDDYYISDEEMLLLSLDSTTDTVDINSDIFTSFDSNDPIIDFVKITFTSIDRVTDHHEKFDVQLTHVDAATSSTVTHSHFVYDWDTGEATDDTPQDITDYAFTSMHFWGENPIGEWSVSVLDDNNDAADVEWQLDIYYHYDSDGDGF